MIYLDYTAHMPACRQAMDAFLEAEAKGLGNANAHHAAGAAANQRMKEARERVARLLHVQPEEIIFTSGASESNNTAVQGIVYANQMKMTKKTKVAKKNKTDL